MIKKIEIPISGKPFKNKATYCVGTGRMGLALQKEYTDHLKIVQEAIKFRYIRGHGLFCDDVGIYREIERMEKPPRFTTSPTWTASWIPTGKRHPALPGTGVHARKAKNR